MSSLGFDPFSWVGRSGMPDDVLMQPADWVPEPALYAFLDLVSSELDIPDFGLVAGQASGLRDLGPFGTSLLQSFTLEHLLATFLGAVNDVSTGADWWLTTEGKETWLCRAPSVNIAMQACEYGAADATGSTAERQAELYSLSLMIQIIRLVATPSWSPARLRVVASEIPSSGLASLASGIDVCCSQPHTAIRFPTSFRGRPLTSGPTSIALTRLRTHLSVTPGSPPSLEDAAGWLGYAPRTLQRELEDHGLTYRRLVDQVRFRHALELLGSQELEMRDIAGGLGYSDPSSFTRSFYRWTGESPRRYRSLHEAHSPTR